MRSYGNLELMGASVHAGSDWDTATVGMTVLSSRLRQALPLFAELLQGPAFTNRDLERLRGERLAELLQLEAEPRELADEMFSRVLYESASRYAEPEDGSAASVRAISRDDVVAFHRARYRAGGRR